MKSLLLSKNTVLTSVSAGFRSRDLVSASVGIVIAALGLLAWPAPASAQYAWAAPDEQAAALLPAPSDKDGPVTGGKLACAEQKWTLSLDTRAGVTVAAAGEAILTVDTSPFDAPFAGVPGGVDITVPRDAIQPLQDGLKLVISLPGLEGETQFALRGSHSAIGAVEERCTPRIVTGANQVVTTPYSSYMNLARKLREDLIEDFTRATRSQPKVSAGDARPGRRKAAAVGAAVRLVLVFR